jgi:hypothetical protein
VTDLNLDFVPPDLEFVPSGLDFVPVDLDFLHRARDNRWPGGAHLMFHFSGNPALRRPSKMRSVSALKVGSSEARLSRFKDDNV